MNHGWFDTGTVAKLVCSAGMYASLYSGTKNGKPDEEVCTENEFKIITVTEKNKDELIEKYGRKQIAHCLKDNPLIFSSFIDIIKGWYTK